MSANQEAAAQTITPITTSPSVEKKKEKKEKRVKKSAQEIMEEMSKLGFAPLEGDVHPAFCFKCKDDRLILVTKTKPAKNKRTEIAQGECPVCKTQVSSIRSRVLSAEEQVVYDAELAQKEAVKAQKKVAAEAARAEKKQQQKEQRKRQRKDSKDSEEPKKKRAKTSEYKNPIIQEDLVAFEKSQRALLAEFKQQYASAWDALVVKAQAKLDSANEALAAVAVSRDQCPPLEQPEAATSSDDDTQSVDLNSEDEE